MLNRSGVYCLKNEVNGKVYIGKSRNIKNRYNKHKLNARNNLYPNIILYRAMNKYGVENFKLSVLEYCTVEELDMKEYYYIKKYNSTDISKGYNMTDYIEPNVPYFKLNEEELNNLIKDLEEECLTKKAIESKYGINRTSINNINTGRSYFREGINYPIRKTKEELITLKYKKILRRCRCGCKYFITYKKDRRKYSLSCRKINQPSKEELYKNLKKHKSFTEVGRMYNKSDNYIRKQCKKYGLPYHTKFYKEG